MMVYTISMIATKNNTLYFYSLIVVGKFESEKEQIWKGQDHTFSWGHTDCGASLRYPSADVETLGRYPDVEVDGNLGWREFWKSCMYRWDLKPQVRYLWETKKKPRDGVPENTNIWGAGKEKEVAEDIGLIRKHLQSDLMWFHKWKT